MKTNTLRSYGSLQDFGLLLLRLAFGLSMLSHGFPKWNSLFSGEEIQFIDPLGIGVTISLALTVFAEVICSLLLAVGFLTCWALIPLIITMAVAFFGVHIHDEFGYQEMSILYGVTYIALFLLGPGRFSIDRLLKR